MEELVQSPLWGAISLIFFVAFFIGVVVWIFRPGAKETYKECGEIPVKKENG
ncbi:MAG: cbb3-type cytochrome c oxidase subunit 3 [Sphingomonadales bacterium]|nr:cbb3-type cytochrome c oxidase subunit 3 [Sphingomonadales bacterium]